MENKYIKRLAENELKLKLNSSGCVLVSGPKFCGKTTMCEQFAKSKHELKDNNAILLAKSDPRSTLNGEKPHLIDEWQKVPDIWNIIKDDLDNDYQFGKYIITDSTTPIDSSKIYHSGAGRITRMILKPFTLEESNETLGIISLNQLFSNPNMNFDFLYSKDNELTLEELAKLMCRGGWPISLQAKKEYQLQVTANYYLSLFTLEDENDEFTLFLKNKNIKLLELILKSFARNISTQCKKKKMINDIISSGIRSKLDEDTFSSYEKVLKDLFIIYDLPSWNLNLRSTVTVRSAPTHHFIDTSIALCSLGIKPKDLLSDIKSFGLFFEDFAVRDLSIYSSSINGTLKHYRDSNGQEVDAIIELDNGDYAAIEIKIASEDNIALGVKSLLAFENTLKRNELKLPLFKMIITSHGSCYKTKEGIYIVPINCLKS